MLTEYGTYKKRSVKEAVMSLTQKRIIAVASALFYIALCALLFIYVGKPFIENIDEPGGFREWASSHGIIGPIVFFIMTVLQVFAAVIPGEPLEIAAGYTFGWFGGTLLCIIGIAVGQALVFLMIKKFGMRALELFVSREKIESVRFLRESGRSFRLLFILFFIPGTPKDILTYCAGLLPINLKSFLIITIFARLPSIVTSTVGGSALSNGDYVFAIIVFAVTAVISIGGLLLYSRIKKSKKSYTKNI